MLDRDYHSFTLGSFGSFGKGTWNVINLSLATQIPTQVPVAITILGCCRIRNAILSFPLASLFSGPMLGWFATPTSGGARIVRAKDMHQA